MAVGARVLGFCLVGLWTPLAGSDGPRSSDLARREAAREQMRMLLRGIFGTGASVGYLGDMGQVPATLEVLAAPTGSPPYTTSNQGGVGMGYNGPYVSRAGSVGSSFVDPWGMPLAIEVTATTMRLRSAGPDRDPATDGDNVWVPLEPRTTHGLIEVEVFAVPGGGGPPVEIDASEVGVSVFYASAGTEASTGAVWDADAGAFRSGGLHLGRHHVRATALTPEDFSISTDSTVIGLRGRKARARLRLVRAASE